jgi:hypothetical protein
MDDLRAEEMPDDEQLDCFGMLALLDYTIDKATGLFPGYSMEDDPSIRVPNLDWGDEVADRFVAQLKEARAILVKSFELDTPQAIRRSKHCGFGVKITNAG